MSSDAQLPIGVFDSGVGGLTVLRALVDRLPDEEMIYLGDTARVPYGNRAADTVRRYALNATHLLVERGIKALVVACNTASAYGLPALLKTYEVPVIGVIDPVARRATRQSSTGHIGVLGTRGTVRSDCYPDAVHQYESDVHVHQQPCPLLVPLAEEGWTDGEVVEEVARHYLSELRDQGIDTVILGCTHYPILRPVLQTVANDVLEEDVSLLDSASATAAALAERLRVDDLRRPEGRSNKKGEPSAKLEFLFTDVSPAFVETTERFFGAHPEEPTHVDITDIASK